MASLPKTEIRDALDGFLKSQMPDLMTASGLSPGFGESKRALEIIVNTPVLNISLDDIRTLRTFRKKIEGLTNGLLREKILSPYDHGLGKVLDKYAKLEMPTVISYRIVGFMGTHDADLKNILNMLNEHKLSSVAVIGAKFKTLYDTLASARESNVIMKMGNPSVEKNALEYASETMVEIRQFIRAMSAVKWGKDGNLSADGFNEATVSKLTTIIDEFERNIKPAFDDYVRITTGAGRTY